MFSDVMELVDAFKYGPGYSLTTKKATTNPLWLYVINIIKML